VDWSDWLVAERSDWVGVGGALPVAYMQRERVDRVRREEGWVWLDRHTAVVAVERTGMLFGDCGLV
jgi:hypothetical protein